MCPTHPHAYISQESSISGQRTCRLYKGLWVFGSRDDYADLRGAGFHPAGVLDSRAKCGAVAVRNPPRPPTFRSVDILTKPETFQPFQNSKVPPPSRLQRKCNEKHNENPMKILRKHIQHLPNTVQRKSNKNPMNILLRINRKPSNESPMRYPVKVP